MLLIPISIYILLAYHKSLYTIKVCKGGHINILDLILVCPTTEKETRFFFFFFQLGKIPLMKIAFLLIWEETMKDS